MEQIGLTSSEKKAAYNKEWVRTHRERVNERARNLRAKDPDKYNSYVRKYARKHREELRENNRVWRRKNRVKLNLDMQTRMSRDINFRIKRLLRTRIYNRIKRHDGLKFSHSNELLGCSIDELMQYIGLRFNSGMTWNNWGKYWHLDHIRPCASFDMSDVEQQKQCWHYTNLQPLLARDNLMKGSVWNGKVVHRRVA